MYCINRAKLSRKLVDIKKGTSTPSHIAQAAYLRQTGPGKIAEEQERLILKARKEGLRDEKIQFIKDIFKNVNPELFEK